MRTAVIGAGAIGGITAAFLARAGHDPEVVCKHADTAEKAAGEGLRVFGVRGDFRAPVKALAAVEELTPGPDVVFLATKATDMLEASQALRPLLKNGSLVVSLQNGLCEEALGRVLGPERMVGCVVGWGATMHGPAELEMTSTGEFVLGALDGRSDPRLGAIGEMLANVVPTRVSANILGELYGKLIINSCITALGGVCGLYLGQMLAQPRARRLFLAIMAEAMAVAEGLRLKVEPGGGGKLDYYRFLAGRGPLASLKRHLTLRLVGHKYRRLKSSLLQSLQRGRPTEIDYLNGYVCAKGREVDVPTPLNDAVVAMIKEIEAGRRAIQPENLAELPGA